jgi:hypothetical protein
MPKPRFVALLVVVCLSLFGGISSAAVGDIIVSAPYQTL